MVACLYVLVSGLLSAHTGSCGTWCTASVPAVSACMEGFQVVTMESVVGEIDIFTSATGNYDIIIIECPRKMKSNALSRASVIPTAKLTWLA